MTNLIFPLSEKEAKKANVPYSSDQNKNALFPSRLRELRNNAKLSQEQLSKEIGVTKSTISLYETGDNVPDVKTFSKIADFYGVPYDYLLGKSDCKKAENHNIHEETGLSEVAIKNLKYCAERGDNSVTRTINALLEEENTLGAIRHYLFYELSKHQIASDRANTVPFYTKYKYSNEDAGWTTDDTPVPVDFDTVIECLTKEKYQRIKMLEIEECLINLCKLMDSKEVL